MWFGVIYKVTNLIEPMVVFLHALSFEDHVTGMALLLGSMEPKHFSPDIRKGCYHESRNME